MSILLILLFSFETEENENCTAAAKDVKEERRQSVKSIYFFLYVSFSYGQFDIANKKLF